MKSKLSIEKIRQRAEERKASGAVGGVREWFEIESLLAAYDEVSKANEVLRRTLCSHAELAERARKQEGSKIHDSCEGHAVCDLVAGVQHDAYVLTGWVAYDE